MSPGPLEFSSSTGRGESTAASEDSEDITMIAAGGGRVQIFDSREVLARVHVVEESIGRLSKSGGSTDANKFKEHS